MPVRPHCSSEWPTSSTSKITVRNATTGERSGGCQKHHQVLTLGVLQNHEIAIAADGPDEEAAIQSLSDLVANNFGEVVNGSQG